MTLKNKLNRFKKHIVSNDRSSKEQEKQMDDQTMYQIDIPYLEEWNAFETKPFYFDHQFSLIRKVSYPLDYLHGLHRFREFYDVIELWEEMAIDHPLAFSDGEPSKMVFFDTETTGLGGVGNMIFLIGYAKIFDDHVSVTQHFLPNPSCEVALYQGFLTDVGDYQAMKLTTYNGKSFDWPQIQTRHTLIRDAVPKLPAFGHFDLLHAARRLWKHKLPSVRLSIVEKEVLNINRINDVHGSLAPLLYFDFLKDQNPKGIKGVFIHNEIDVLSLISLYIHISKKLLNKSLLKPTNEEKYEIARWFESLGQIKFAEHLYEELVYQDHVRDNQLFKSLASIYKKQKHYDKAAEIWTKLVENQLYADEEAATELSKLYEHHWKDFERALYYAKIAYQTWKEKKRIRKTVIVKDKAAYQKRIARLEEKIKG
ncbi:ribonuclease H-like domain-containing protein [Calidifontibacillus erzurumensis]|uniref:Ribonuclease H-like domain-containing protein n=1 Tax=Calidifontibacillus erzurumensis TaxID=2741433 RepID=A0A8J8GFG0_9BACI|nr:ribonuclease H-like domain-containing protein [Calidifontibacillus erzurumensis]NSL52667.1 ribonuclease H-like domain-containing protein [Calidifontibacillus erzurumensis]